jgi:aromatic-L-amino-acid decarboxylase
MAGTAALCPELRYIHDGLEHADSYCFNPHKWMFTNFDCTAFYVRNRKALIDALSVLPEYLRNQASEAGAVIDYRDWHVPLGRRFRALKLWFVIRYYGVEGLRHHIRRHIELARDFEQRVLADPRFELAAPRSLNLVCFRLRDHEASAAKDLRSHHRRSNEKHASAAPDQAQPNLTAAPATPKDADAMNAALLDAVNRSGKAFLSHTKLSGRYTLRMSIGQTHTESRHVEAAWNLIQAAADALTR